MGRFAFQLLVLLSTGFMAGCGSKDRMSTLDPKGPVAQMQYDLFMVTVWVTLFIFITVGATLLYTVFRFREKKSDRDKPLPRQSHGHPLIEMGLIAVSILMLVIIAVPTLRGIWMMHEMPEDGEVIEINVSGFQWWWSFEYPDYGVVTANELVIPVGKTVKLNLRAMDVIHSFWIPKLAGKTDLMPGRPNWMWIQADEEGHYYGQCAEFCGEAHAYMLFRADAVEEGNFKTWIEAQQSAANPPAGESWSKWYEVSDKNPKAFAGDPVQGGAQLFLTKGGCVQCHTINGSMRAVGIIGPDLTHVASRTSLGAGLLDNRVDPDDPESVIDRDLQHANLLRWISRSEEVKPGNLMYETVREKGLTDDEFGRIATYLQTLK